MAFLKSSENTPVGLKIIRTLMQAGMTKYGLASLLGIRFNHIHSRLKGEYGISEFYVRVLLAMRSIANKSKDENNQFSEYIFKKKFQERRDQPVYQELKKKFNPDPDIRAEMILEKNQKILREKHTACQLCGRTDIALHCHHIITRGEAGGSVLVHTLKNLILLCVECHSIMHSKKHIRDILVKDRKLYYLKKIHGGNNPETDQPDPQGENLGEG